MATPRCPHCASPKIIDRVCRVCGRSVEETPDLPRLEELQHTHHEERVRKRAEEPVLAKKVCARCSVPNPPERVLCLACGHRL